MSKPQAGIDFLPDGYVPPPAKAPPLGRLLVVFGAIFLGLQWAWSAARDSAFERIAIDLLTVRPLAWLIRGLSPDVQAQAVGSSIQAPGGGINILNGCDGFEVLFLLYAAIVVAPLGGKQKVIAWLGGTLLVWLLNQARVLALFYAYRADKALFDLLHGTLGPLLLVGFVAAAFALYLAGPGRVAQA